MFCRLEIQKGFTRLNQGTFLEALEATNISWLVVPYLHPQSHLYYISLTEVCIFHTHVSL